MALVNSGTIVQDWKEVVAGEIQASPDINVSENYETTLHLQAGLTSITANNGTKFIVQTSWNTSGDEDWQEYISFTRLAGTAQILILDGDEAAGQTTIADAADSIPGTGVWCLFKDDVPFDSELVFVEFVDTGFFNVLDPTTNAHATASSDFFAGALLTDEVAFSRSIIIQGTNIKRARIIIDNNQDTSGPSLLYKLAKAETTSL